MSMGMCDTEIQYYRVVYEAFVPLFFSLNLLFMMSLLCATI